MEKRNTRGLRIAVTGPESTGKSVMADYLAEKFKGIFIPEYAREYVDTINRPYNYDDLLLIAREQIRQYQELQQSADVVFFDTWLIITKVWFDWVYGKVPDFVEENIRSCPIDLFLLLQPDIPWVADPARENGGESRQRLLERYRQELDYYHFKYVEIDGIGDQRYVNAEKEISFLLK